MGAAPKPPQGYERAAAQDGRTSRTPAAGKAQATARRGAGASAGPPPEKGRLRLKDRRASHNERGAEGRGLRGRGNAKPAAPTGATRPPRRQVLPASLIPWGPLGDSLGTLLARGYARARPLGARVRGGCPLFIGVSGDLWYQIVPNRVPFLLKRMPSRGDASRQMHRVVFAPSLHHGHIPDGWRSDGLTSQ